MALRTRLWATGLATAALLALPLLASAQTYPPNPPSSQTTQTLSSTKADSAEHHLTEAGRALDSISTSTLSTGAGALISQIRTNFSALVKSYHGNSVDSTSGTSGTTGSSSSSVPPCSASSSGVSGSSNPGMGGTSATGQNESSQPWMACYNSIEQTLDTLNIPKSDVGQTAGMSGTTGTSGTAGTSGMSSDINPTAGAGAQAVALDASTKSKLADFRKHLEEFRTAVNEGR
jgi:hypothetical protein